MNTTLNEIADASGQIKLSWIVETFLKSIKQWSQSSGESYEDTVGRFSDRGMDEEVLIMIAAGKKWWELE